MKNFKNFAIYGLSVGSLSNICATDEIENDIEYDFDEVDDYNFAKKLDGLVNVLKSNDKDAGLNFLNTYIFNTKKDIRNLEKYGNIKYKLCVKEGKTNKNLLILFHGLGQEIEEYFLQYEKTGKTDIDILQEKFGADVLLIEYDFNGDNNNTFDGMDKYCEDVAKFILTEFKEYDDFTFFGYSLGSFVGNLTRQKFNNIKAENVKSKYIGYKGIKDLDNAGSSFITKIADGYISEEEALQILNNKGLIKNIGVAINDFNKGDINAVANDAVDAIDALLNNNKDENNNNKFNSFSDVFKYLLGDDEFKKIKELTNNAEILKGTKGFNNDKVVFKENLATNDHRINLQKDIDNILEVFNSNENKDKDVFLFQCKGGDEVVGNGMKDTYDSLMGEKTKPTDPKAPKVDPEKGNEDGQEDSTSTQQQGGQSQGGGQTPTKQDTEKSSSCCSF